MKHTDRLNKAIRDMNVLVVDDKQLLEIEFRLSTSIIEHQVVETILKRNNVFILKDCVEYLDGLTLEECIDNSCQRVLDLIMLAGIAKYDEIAGTNKQPF